LIFFPWFSFERIERIREAESAVPVDLQAPRDRSLTGGIITGRRARNHIRVPPSVRNE
jgi:hypothetical protein